MILKANEMRKEEFENFLGGKGILVNTYFLEKENASGAGRLFSKSVLKPQSSIGNHPHKGDFEVYYILKGKALVEDNGTKHELEEGDAILTKSGEAHSIENIGKEDLEYIALILFEKQ